MRFWVGLLLLLTMTGLVGATELDGKTVLFVVTEHRSNDAVQAGLESELMRLRAQLGLSEQEMPIEFLGYADSDAAREQLGRLGFKAEDSPVMCVVEWGNPARFGPKRVLGQAIVRRAQVGHVGAIMNAYLAQTGRVARLPEPEGFGLRPSPATAPVADTVPGRLEIDNVRFEVGGKTMFLTHVGARIRNLENRTLRDVKFRFFARAVGSSQWKLVYEQTVDKILANNTLVRDHMGDSQKLGLVGDDGYAVSSQYRVEVEHVGQVVSKEGEFIPITER
ncbi:MAG: hypothetical protein WC314_24810 [Vulcanimicrobiota bacterium]